jgi:hypothetical protein
VVPGNDQLTAERELKTLEQRLCTKIIRNGQDLDIDDLFAKQSHLLPTDFYLGA